MKCGKCGDEITNLNGGSGTEDYAECGKCSPINITVEKEIPKVEQEEVEVKLFNKQRTPEQKKKKLIIGLCCMLIAFAVTAGIFITRNENPMFGSKITFGNGCEEVYNFDGEMLTEECTEGRRIAEELNERRTLNSPQPIAPVVDMWPPGNATEPNSTEPEPKVFVSKPIQLPGNATQ